jgi:hypothetical protein
MKRLTQKEYKEFKELHKDENRYAIFIEGNDEPIEFLWSKTRDFVVQKVEEYEKTNSDKNVYYKLYDPYFILTNDGTNDVLLYERSLYEKIFEYQGLRGILSYMWDGIYWSIKGKLENIKYFFKDLFYWIKNYSLGKGYSHNRIEWYCLTSHILEDIKFNVKKLIKDMHGCPTTIVEEAKTFFKDKNFKDETEAGIELWKIRLNELLEIVYRYEFYTNYGFCTNSNDEYAVRIAETYKDTIPYYPKSKDLRYDELDKLIHYQWEKFCEWMKKYGQDLWD